MRCSVDVTVSMPGPEELACRQADPRADLNWQNCVLVIALPCRPRRWRSGQDMISYQAACQLALPSKNGRFRTSPTKKQWKKCGTVPSISPSWLAWARWGLFGITGAFKGPC